MKTLLRNWFLAEACFLYTFLLIWSRRSEHACGKTNAQMISFIKTAKDRQQAGFCIPEAIDYNTVMLRTGADISGAIDRVRAYLTALGLEKQIKIAFDEWNLRGWWHPNLMDTGERSKLRNEDEAFYHNSVIAERDKNDINSVYTMADAVFSASFLNTCLRNCDLVRMACFSPVVNTRGAIFTHENGVVLRPQYFVFELYANLLKETVLDVWKEDVPTRSGCIRDDVKTVDTADIVITYDGKTLKIIFCLKTPPDRVRRRYF